MPAFFTVKTTAYITCLQLAPLTILCPFIMTLVAGGSLKALKGMTIICYAVEMMVRKSAEMGHTDFDELHREFATFLELVHEDVKKMMHMIYDYNKERETK